MKFGDGASVGVLQGRAQMTIVGRLTPDNALIYSLARLTHVHTPYKHAAATRSESGQTTTGGRINARWRNVLNKALTQFLLQQQDRSRNSFVRHFFTRINNNKKVENRLRITHLSVIFWCGRASKPESWYYAAINEKNQLVPTIPGVY